MPLVPAICTQCGGKIKADTSKEAAICPFCGTPYIVEKAISKYNVSLNNSNLYIGNAVIKNGDDADNLVARGDQFLYIGDTDKALSYYNRALDIDINCLAAINGIEELNRRYLEEVRNSGIDLDDPAFYDDALEVYKTVLYRAPDNTEIQAKVDKIRQYYASTPVYSDDAKTRLRRGKMDIYRMRIEFSYGKEKKAVFPFKEIKHFTAKEDMWFEGEKFARSTPNCISFYFKGENYTFRIHKAAEIAQTVRKWERTGFDIINQS